MNEGEWEQTTARARAETRSYRNSPKQLSVPISSASAAAVLYLHAWLFSVVLAKNHLLKLCSPILAPRTGIPHYLPGNPWQPVCSVRESTRDAAQGESFVPGWVSWSQWQAVSVGLYLLPVHTPLSHLERWTVVARPCLEILQETTERPHGDPHIMKTWNPCSLTPNSLTPHRTFPSLTRDAFLLQSSMHTQI